LNSRGYSDLPRLLQVRLSAAKNIGVAPELETRLGDRVRLLQEVDPWRRELDRSCALAAMDEFNQLALKMLTSRAVRNAFDLSRDHWPSAMSILATGGGMRTGQIIGATNGRSEIPIGRPAIPQRFAGDGIPIPWN
jgi:hypothetical protein